MRWLATLAGAVMTITAADATESARKLGDWRVTTTRDRFSDKTDVIATRVDNGRSLSVRCMSDRPSLLLRSPGDFVDEGADILVAVRADRGAVIDTIGRPLRAGSLEISALPAILQSLQGAREIAFRIHGTRRQSDFIIRLGRSKDALAAAFERCAL